MKSIVINFYGGSGLGKSTLAAALYAKMKMNGDHTELVREYIKKWAWKDLKPGKYDQIYILGKQINAESDLYEKVDYIITDSPILIAPFFEQYLLGVNIIKNTALDFMKYAEDNGVHYLHFWLERPENFDSRGRYETKEEAIKIDLAMERWLTEVGVKLIKLPVDHEERISLILNELTNLK